MYPFLWILLASRVLSIFVDEAGVVDWHYSLLGSPNLANTFFHQPYPDSKASLLYTLSDSNYIGAVNPKDGAIVWRHSLGSNVPGRLSTDEGRDVILSAVNNTATAWNAVDGRPVWQQAYADAQVHDVQLLGGSKDQSLAAAVAVAGETTHVHIVDLETGDIVWTYHDSSGDTPYRLVQSGQELFYVSVSKSMLKGYKIKVTSLDVQSGKAKESHTLGSEGDVNSLDDILLAHSRDGLPLLFWTDSARTSVKANFLGTKKVETLDTKGIDQGVTQISLHSSGSHDAPPQFLVQFQGPDWHSARVYSYDQKKANVKKAYDLPRVTGKGAFAATLVSGRLYFTRVSADVMELFSTDSSVTLASWPVKKDGPSSISGEPTHASSEVVVRPGNSFAVRCAVAYSSGDWKMLRNGEENWNRPEYMADIIKAEWAEYTLSSAEAASVEYQVQQNPVPAYIARVQRHFALLQDLSAYLPDLPQTIMQWTADIFGRSSQHASSKLKTFGFNKVVIVASQNGRVTALDAGNHGSIIVSIASGKSSEQLEKADLSEEISSSSSVSLRPITSKVDFKARPAHSYILENGHLQGRTGSTKTWSFVPLPGHQIRDIIRTPSTEPIASIGKVLGDRRVLYKYLDPNLILVITEDRQRRSMAVSLLDSISGNCVYTVAHERVDLSRPIAAVMSENWFCYSFPQEPEKDEQLSKGYQLVVGEVYESDLPNDRGHLDKLSNFTSTAPSSSNARPSKPYVIAQSFQTLEEISQMTVTQTNQGITSRQLLVTVPSTKSLVGIPRQILDPRRPVGKDPTSQQQEEGLMKYAPVVDFDPKWHLNHVENLDSVRGVITTPTILESTSLVVAYGQDLFGTRVAPSFAYDILGNSFNKIQLVLTVVALTGGVFVVAPIIKRKQTNSMWQAVS